MCVIGGGYSSDINELSLRHTIVHRAATKVISSSFSSMMIFPNLSNSLRSVALLRTRMQTLKRLTSHPPY